MRENTNIDVRTSMAAFARTSSSLVIGVFWGADIRVDAKSIAKRIYKSWRASFQSKYKCQGFLEDSESSAAWFPGPWDSQYQESMVPDDVR